MSRLDKWIDNKIVQNLFIWFFLFIILLSTIQAENKALTTFFAILLLAPAVYINNLFILPLFRKKTLIFFLLFIGNTLFFSAIAIFFITLFENQAFEWKLLFNFLGIMILALVFGSALKMARDSIMRRQQEKEAELKLLKAQLNPHFLFNTLNNLYGLSVMKSDKLPGLMLKLSDLLRYSLYETKETLVPLEKEIQYLENYISLEKIRLEDTTAIQFTKTGNLSSQKIAPMLFIVFVENAFKYLGVSVEEKSRVVVSIKEVNDRLIFKCENTKYKMGAAIENLEKGKNGIGLMNAKKRLTLMYPERHSLLITENDKTYNIELAIDL
ncbi:sensor histidine kinase [Gillisia limnaea]|uniref:Putative signal transduction histidine kinase n=1 Tax=Gillisia limnaea (strain DSM 15749 / LMG 21470 / R-8282) TaxID=865937 RepID=H2BY58_GILLR|nr:putative signal transduction histidine kinase [Gillisia limnaea DSM 15749]